MFSLRYKFIIQVFLLVLLVTGVLSTYLLDNSRKKQLENLNTKSELILENLNTVCSEGIVQDDLIVINDSLKRYTTDPEVDYVVIYDARGELLLYNDGDIIADNILLVTNEAVKYFIAGENAELLLARAVSNYAFYTNTRGTPPALKSVRLTPSGETVNDFVMPIKYKTSFIKEQLGTIRIGFNTRIVNASIRSTRTKIFLFIFVVLLAASFATFLSSRSIIEPIRKLSEHFRIVGQGDLERKISLKRGDEIGLMAREFDEMTGKLSEAQKELIEKSLIERDIQVASDIQSSLLPDNYIVKDNLEMAGYSKPAKGVGGDYFDFIPIDDEREGIVICDVAGKGIPASLLMVMLKTIFHVSRHASHRETNKICSIANQFLAKTTPPNRFVTAQYVIINRLTGELNFTNAGHGLLYIYRKSQNDFEKINLHGNIPLGIREQSTYDQISSKLQAGDIVLFFTDGVFEARNSSGASYGREKVEEIVKSLSDEDARVINNKIIDDIRIFEGDAPPADDLTLMTIKFNGPSVN